MADVTFITVGALKEGYLKEATAEYKKRITQYARVEEIELREERISDEDNSREVAAALEREADKILAAVPKGARIIALCVEGKQMDSLELAGYVGDTVNACGRLAFIIGSYSPAFLMGELLLELGGKGLQSVITLLEIPHEVGGLRP